MVKHEGAAAVCSSDEPHKYGGLKHALGDVEHKHHLEDVEHKHHLEDVENLLEAVGGFIGTTKGTGAGGAQEYRFRPQTYGNCSSNNHEVPASGPTGSCARRKPPRAATAAVQNTNSGRLPRLYTQLSAVSATNSSTTNMLKQPPEMRSISFARPSTQQERECFVFNLQDDPLDLMLRSRTQPRPDVQGLVKFGINDKEPRHEHLNAGKVATAGVFRLAHPDTGFVHYGYSWDITRAEEDQLRLLKAGRGGSSSGSSSSNKDSEFHPHRGLSDIVCGHYASGGLCTERKEGEDASRWDRAAGTLRFEVVRSVPLPTRFRVSDFEDTMREACAEELWHRRAHLLVLMARRYQRKHCNPAFRRMLTTCRALSGIENHAAALEAQRAWRGFRGRVSARHKREERRRERLRIEREKMSGILAVWVQARHRGMEGRRRANRVRENNATKELVERKRRSSAEAAGAIQRWLRSTSQRRKYASELVDEAATNGASSASPTDVDDDEGKPCPSGENRDSRKDTMGAARGPPRAISPSEVRVAEGLGRKENMEGPLPSKESDRSVIESREGSAEVYDGIATRQGKRQRPSSSRLARNPLRDSSAPDRGKGRGRRRPSSGSSSARQLNDGMFAGPAALNFGKGNVADDELLRTSASPDSSDRDIISRMTIGRVPTFVPPAPDASRLVLEGDPLFTAAAAIQAAWRGFIERLRIRKRRRTAEALRRKREGKWRQQRGVVGKKVAVGWDDRRGLEERDGEEEGQGRVGSSCIDIQVKGLCSFRTQKKNDS